MRGFDNNFNNPAFKGGRVVLNAKLDYETARRFGKDESIVVLNHQLLVARRKDYNDTYSQKSETQPSRRFRS